MTNNVQPSILDLRTHGMKPVWYLDVFGDRCNLNSLSSRSRATFQCHVAGTITDVRVRGFVDNYPYFSLACKIDGFEVSASHKLSWMIASGGILLSEHSKMRGHLPDLVPDSVGYGLTSDGSDVKFIPKAEIESSLGDAKVEFWITDPRLHYLALLALLYEDGIISRWVKRIPSWRQAIDVLTRFGLYGRFRESPKLADDAYDNMSVFLRALRVSEPDSFFQKFAPELPDSDSARPKETFLLNCHVAGTSHSKTATEHPEEIKPGLALTLRREPKNKYDKRAISVLLSSGERFGYVPRIHNSVIANLMDAGKSVFARVSESKQQGTWLHSRIDVFLKD